MTDFPWREYNKNELINEYYKLKSKINNSKANNIIPILSFKYCIIFKLKKFYLNNLY